jgi:hypothetical protein
VRWQRGDIEDTKNLYRFYSHTFACGGGNHWWEVSFLETAISGRRYSTCTCSQGRDGLKDMLLRPQRSQGPRGRGALAVRPLRPQEHAPKATTIPRPQWAWEHWPYAHCGLKNFMIDLSMRVPAPALLPRISQLGLVTQCRARSGIVCLEVAERVDWVTLMR